MTHNEFIRLEAQAIRALSRSDAALGWQAVESGAVDAGRIYAAGCDYQISLDELMNVILAALCAALPGQRI